MQFIKKTEKNTAKLGFQHRWWDTEDAELVYIENIDNIFERIKFAFEILFKGKFFRIIPLSRQKVEMTVEWLNSYLEK